MGTYYDKEKKNWYYQFFILFHYVSKKLYPMAIPNNFYKSSSSNKNCSISSENSLQSIFNKSAISFLTLSGKGL